MTVVLQKRFQESGEKMDVPLAESVHEETVFPSEGLEEFGRKAVTAWIAPSHRGGRVG